MMQKLLPFSLLSLLALSACSNAKERLGLAKHAPDEFLVVKHAPLEMPDHFELIPPQPGAPRPQERAVSLQVRQDLMGEVQDVSHPTGAEVTLLEQAAIAGSSQDIRRVIDQESTEKDTSHMSVSQRLLGFGGTIKDTSVLDPVEEAQRLKEGNQAKNVTSIPEKI